ncbi:hypothetical protein CgunFtcFv8_023302 [Champsocephalus gunnari]|uniref:Uncharacterized protein n=1 Tax=Champsocephalus gunnari TaxID=52237 RepID=A0AAN8HPL7_CHAGU|nr:hypothetical protein CgunFtcFv8_023302 [Champsocephalus gunnari]
MQRGLDEEPGLSLSRCWSHDLRLCPHPPLPPELHVMLIMMLPGRLEEDGSACFIYVCCPEKTRRRRDELE